MAGPHIQAIQISCQLCSNVDIKDSWAHQILQRAHINLNHFGLGLSLGGGGVNFFLEHGHMTYQIDGDDE